jgi:hypothetical protein
VAVSTEERILNPEEPVSTKTSLTVWQVEVPGAHTVTLAKAPLA